jgi:hypothetical protein
VQRFDRFLDWCVGIETVNLVEVDEVGAEPAQRGVDGLEDVLP